MTEIDGGESVGVSTEVEKNADHELTKSRKLETLPSGTSGGESETDPDESDSDESDPDETDLGGSDLTGSTEPVVSPDGKIVWEGAAVEKAEIPDSIPVYDKVTAKSGSSDDRFFTFEWETTESKQDVMDFYREELPAKGWTIETERSYGSFKATQGKREISVWIGSEANKPTSILVRMAL